MNYFIVLFHGSSGSSWFCDVLGQYPRVCIPSYEPLADALDISDATKQQWIEACFNAPRTKQELEAWEESLAIIPSAKIKKKEKMLHATFVGFKARWREISADVINEVHKKHPLKVIVLTRSNKVKQAVSLFRKMNDQKGQFENKGIQPPSYIPVEELDKKLNAVVSQTDQTFEVAQAIQTPKLYITYEELLQDYETTMRKSLNFLGLRKESVIQNTFYSKTTSDDLKEALLNYEELKAHYKGTEFEKYF